MQFVPLVAFFVEDFLCCSKFDVALADPVSFICGDISERTL